MYARPVQSANDVLRVHRSIEHTMHPTHRIKTHLNRSDTKQRSPHRICTPPHASPYYRTFIQERECSISAPDLVTSRM